MNISKDMRSKIISEIEYVTDKMKKNHNPLEKLYYFSAIFGLFQRVINFECDPELIFIYQVSNLTYNALNSRIGSMAQRADAGVNLPDKAFEKIENDLEELANQITLNKPVYDILQDMANIAYSATGNGYYLYQKGMLKL
jgi:hypothetical protein